MDFPQTVKNTLSADILEMSTHLSDFVTHPGKDFTRNRKLGFLPFMDLFLSMGSNTINHELIRYFNFDTSRIPRVSAFCQQQDKLNDSAFYYLLHRFNSHFPLTQFENGYFLIAVDGSEFNIARNPDDPTTFHEPNGKSKSGFNMLHTVSLFDLPSKRYLDTVIQPGREKNEFHAFCTLMDRYSYGGQPIFVADRGFASYNVFAHAMQNGHSFVIRAKDINIKRILKMDLLPDALDTEAEVILTRSQSKKKRLQPERGADYRYVCKNVTFDYLSDRNPEYSMGFRIIRFDLGDGNFENLVTNLPDSQFPAEKIKEIYWLRWGIETSFRDLKHSIGTVNFHFKKVPRIAKEILARILLFDFCSIITMHSVVNKFAKKHFHQVNFSNALKICHDFLRLKGKAPDIESLIGRYTLPVRHGRDYARQHNFHPPMRFAYRFC